MRAVFYAAVQLCRLQTLLGALAALEQRQALDHQGQLTLEWARSAVRVAERHSMPCDPATRPGARALDKRWTDALDALLELE